MPQKKDFRQPVCAAPFVLHARGEVVVEFLRTYDTVAEFVTKLLQEKLCLKTSEENDLGDQADAAMIVSLDNRKNANTSLDKGLHSRRPRRTFTRSRGRNG